LSIDLVNHQSTKTSKNSPSSLEFFTIKTELIATQDLPGPVCEDPDDDKFFCLCHYSKLIISGDKHLLKVSGFRE